MSGQTEFYEGYVNTNFIRSKAGFKADFRITDNEINTCIKAAEEIVNDATNLLWNPYPTASSDAPNIIREATKFFAIAMLRNIYPDENNTYQKNYDMGMALLKQFTTTNPTGAVAVQGDTVLSDYNADTNNEDVAPDLTTKTFNRDYVPTYRSVL